MNVYNCIKTYVEINFEILFRHISMLSMLSVSILIFMPPTYYMKNVL